MSRPESMTSAQRLATKIGLDGLALGVAAGVLHWGYALDMFALTLLALGVVGLGLAAYLLVADQERRGSAG